MHYTANISAIAISSHITMFHATAEWLKLSSCDPTQDILLLEVVLVVKLQDSFLRGEETPILNPISIKVGTLSKNEIKTKICNLFIHLNRYLTEKGQIQDFQYFHWWLYLLNIDTCINWCLQHTQDKLGQRHVCHWETSPFLLISLCNSLGTEDINCCSFASGIFAQSWCIQGLSCSKVCGCHCLILLFMMRHTFSIEDRSGLQAGQSHALYSVTCVPGKNCSLDCYICLSKIPSLASTSMIPSHICRSQRLVFALFIGNSLDGLFHLWHVESNVRFYQKQAWMWTRLTREHVSTVFRSISDDFGPRELCTKLINAFLLHDANSSCISWCSGGLSWVTMIFQSTAEPYVHHGSMMVSQTIPSEGSMVMHSAVVCALGFILTPWIFSQY